MKSNYLSDVYSISGNSRHWGWGLDVGLGILIFISLASLQPRMPDGDGLYHASRAIYQGFLDGMDPKHLIYAGVLRCVYLSLLPFDLRGDAIEALSATSHLAAVGIFLLLARKVYPWFIKNLAVSYICAIGVVVSFGVMSRASTIETYTLALLTDVAVIALCLNGDFRLGWTAIAAGLLYVVAIGFHVTNVLLGPLVIGMLILRAYRSGAWSSLAWFGGTVVFGMALLLALFLIGKEASLWPPHIAQIFPRGDVQPPLSLTARLGRAVYGLFRSIAWLPPLSELSAGFALGYLVALIAASMTVLYMISHGFFQHLALYGLLGLMLALVAIPFMGVGIYYFPSDPERWLFLSPIIWLLIGLIWSKYNPAPGAFLTRRQSIAMLAMFVVALSLYNGGYKLLPEARQNRDLQGLQELAKVISSKDLVITPAGITSRIYEFFLAKPSEFDNLTLTSLVDKYGPDREGLQSYLRTRITERLRRGEHVYVHHLIDEGYVKAKGYPWAHFTEFDYGPETFLAVIREFNPRMVIPPTAIHPGIYSLQLSNMHAGRESAFFDHIGWSTEWSKF